MDDGELSYLRAELKDARVQSGDALMRIALHEATCAARYMALAKKLDMLFWVVGAMMVMTIFGTGTLSHLSNAYTVLSRMLPLL